MRLTRIHCFTTLTEGESAVVTGNAAQHLRRVLRARPGDSVVLFDGSGNEFHAVIDSSDERSTTLRVLGRTATRQTESPLKVTLVQGVSRGERMDFVLQKATELGVTTIVPVVTERGVVRLDTDQARRRLDHWRAIMVAACEQCGRTVLPGLMPVTTLTDHLTRADTGATRVMLTLDGTRSLMDAAEGSRFVEILIGPEGGLSPAEQEMAHGAGFVGTTLGPRVLRTETAALVALTIVQLVAGDLCGD